MKPKHIESYIRQCQIIAQLSPCVRRKYGAIAVDPTHNVIITSGYNGTPRGSLKELCGGTFCARSGLKPTDVPITERDGKFWLYSHLNVTTSASRTFPSREEAEYAQKQILDANPPVPSGTRYEVGCHHSEGNVVTNAARLGRSLSGAWVFCTGVPCPGCARLLHHAGVARIYTIKGSFSGENGLAYLQDHGVTVVEVEAPPNLYSDIAQLIVEVRCDHPEASVTHILLALEEILKDHPYEGDAVDRR